VSAASNFAQTSAGQQVQALQLRGHCQEGSKAKEFRKAKSPPDGHVVMFGDSGALAINPALNASLGYDPTKDFTPVTALVSLPTIMTAHPSMPPTLAEFTALSRKEPGKMSHGSAGADWLG
jgi:tripartite-type tricarboxylate transporter receptor subunit TctC